MSEGQMQEGWYYAQGDAPGTRRFWDGTQWVGGPRPADQIDSEAAPQVETPRLQPPGWYYAQGDPEGTQRYWDGSTWQGPPQPVPGANVGEAARSGEGLDTPLNRRIAARLLDGIAWFLVAIIIQLIFGAEAFQSGRAGFGKIVLITAVVGLVGLAYEVVMLANLGATGGKLALNLRVDATDGAGIDYLRALRRAAMLYGAVIACYLLWLAAPSRIIGAVVLLAIAGAGLYYTLSEGKTEMPWDKVAGTTVVEA